MNCLTIRHGRWVRHNGDKPGDGEIVELNWLKHVCSGSKRLHLVGPVTLRRAPSLIPLPLAGEGRVGGRATAQTVAVHPSRLPRLKAGVAPQDDGAEDVIQFTVIVR